MTQKTDILETVNEIIQATAYAYRHPDEQDRATEAGTLAIRRLKAQLSEVTDRPVKTQYVLEVRMNRFVDPNQRWERDPNGPYDTPEEARDAWWTTGRPNRVIKITTNEEVME